MCNAAKIIGAYRTYDIVYVTNSRGIKLIAFLRALKLFPKPVCMLMHWGIAAPSANRFKRFFSHLYIKGFDCLLFFNKELLTESQKNCTITAKVVHWGSDVDFYKNIVCTEPTIPFLSTGTERRDFSTLIRAFENQHTPCTLYLTEKSGNINYKSLFDTLSYNKSLIDAHFLQQKIDVLAISSSAQCIVICLSPFARGKIYPLGLTSLLEAMSLAKPVIITHNLYNGIDVERIGCGISVAYGDITGWENAIQYMKENKEIAQKMGQRGREYVEKHYNLDIFAAELSDIFKEIYTQHYC
jgi:glycosyltransferase involved in cell wall biosynthesis